MKNIFENSDTFTAYATIDAGYKLMTMAQGELDNFCSKRTVLDKMIDEASGFMADKMEKHIAYLQECLLAIIESKKFVEADYKSDEEMLIKLQNLKS